MCHFRKITVVLERGKERQVPLFEKNRRFGAYLSIYTCPCGKCKINRNAISHFKTIGHIDNWVDSVLSIQNAMIRELAWRADTSISVAVNFEIEKTNWRPRDDQLLRWGAVLEQESAAKGKDIEKADEEPLQC
jgi:hypothetical protein